MKILAQIFKFRRRYYFLPTAAKHRSSVYTIVLTFEIYYLVNIDDFIADYPLLSRAGEVPECKDYMPHLD